jgi:hypothetical protein
MPAAAERHSRRSCFSRSAGTASCSACGQGDLFAQATICDYVFERDRI